MKFYHPTLRAFTASTLLAIAAVIPSPGQAYTPIDPNDALGIWDFDSTVSPTQSADLLTGTPVVFEGNTAYSADAAGRSGQAGDRSINFGTAGNSAARITNAAFMELLNSRNLSGDQISIVFWQRWDAATTNSSSVWFRSAATGNRGLQGHLPWSDGNMYYDHSGCCVVPAQRLTTASSSVPGLNWQQWTHIALIKNGGAKQIWINGQLANSVASGAAALTGDWTEVLLGRTLDTAANVLKGRIDDFAIFNTALQPAHITALATGTDPLALVVAPVDRVPTFGAFAPPDGTTFHPVGGGLGFTVSAVAPNTLAPGNIRLFLNGADVTSTLSIGGVSNNRTVTSSAALLSNRFYTARAEATDQAGRSGSHTWTFDTANPATTPAHPPLNLPTLATASPQTIDGNPATFTETSNSPGSFLELELDRHVRASRIDLVAPAGANYSGILNGTRLRVFGLRDQLLYETIITFVEPGGTRAVFLPPGIDARLLRLDLPSGQTNGRGDHRIALADWRVLGDPSPAIGPLNLASIASATQTSTTGGNTASLALDGDAATLSETQDLTNSHWLLTLDRDRPVRRVEIVAPNNSFSPRLSGLTVRLLDGNSTTLATTPVTHPGAGGTWGFDIPPGTADARYLRVGLENGALNGYGDRVVSLAGVSLFTGTNYALGTPSYMVKLADSQPSPSLANDGNHATFTESTTATVDYYWETDLGQERALHSIRVVAFDNAEHRRRMTHATVRLFDANHDSIFSQKLAGTSAIFDIALPGPLAARYVRVGLENKERTSATGGTEWWVRLREVQAFGLPLGDTGLTGFSATPSQITTGQTSTLSWQENDLHQLSLYPAIGSVGSQTTPQGSGSLVVNPTATTEYLLVGEGANGPVTRAVTVTVNGQLLPPRISEFVASNRFSLSDGYRQEPDWIEIHNPNATPLNLGGYGLSDTIATPLKWLFPTGTIIPASSHLVVFASGNPVPLDPAGNLHADFSLASTGESLVLAAPNGSVIDSIPNFPAQTEDLAYGRALDGSLGFLSPTPRRHNLSNPLAGWLLGPTFSHTRGFHDTAFSLVLTQTDPAAQLFYSTDGTEPATPYTGPIAINGSLGVRATVRRAGYLSPPVVTHTYVFRSTVMSSPLMNTTYTQGALAPRLQSSLTQIPTVCLSVPVLPDDYVERPASIEVFLPDGSPPLQVNAGLARFGGAYTQFAKKSYRVHFRSEYGAKRLESPIFRGFDRGMAALDEIDTLDLSAGNQDMSQRGFYMANRFIEDTMLEMGSLNPHGRFVHVYINGTYWGQYNAHERLDDDFLAGYLGGSDDDYLVVRGNDNVGSNFVNGTPDPDKRGSWEGVRADRNSYLAVKNCLDVSHLIDFMLVWFYGNSEAEFRAAGPVNPGTGFKFWIADGDGFLRTSALTLDTTTNTGPGGLFGTLVTEGHPDFKILLADRIHRHFFNNGSLTTNRNLARLNTRMTEIQDSLIAECARWGYRTPTNWESSAQTIRTGLFPQRTTNLLGFLRTRGFYPTLDAPVFSQHGGSVSSGQAVSISAGTGTIYYTLDGSDPRLAGGNLSPTALSITAGAPIVLNLNSTLKARFRSGSTWSALTAADFSVTHPLATAGPYALSRWNANEPAGTAPPNMRFFQSDQQDPVLASPMDQPWTQPFKLTDRSRINGLGLPGIGFINTGSPQLTPGAGYVGAAVLALDTRGSQDIRVRWTGGTVAPNDRDHGIRLQYRIGNTTSFLDVPGPGGAPIEYLRSANAGHSTVLGPHSLPAAADNQPLVEVRWKYYFRSGTSGARAQLRLDEIQVSAGPVIAESLAITTASATAQAGALSAPVVVHALGRNGVIAENFNGSVTLAIAGQPGMLGGTVTRSAINGIATFDNLVFPAPGLRTLTAASAGLTAATYPLATRVAGLAELIVPAFIQGAFPVNDRRVPHASLLRIDGLLPSATYRYANQIVTDTDLPEAEGAGNMIFATGNGGAFIRSTASPRFLPGDLNVRHGEFTTGPDGSHTGWFVIEPTSNIRFTPGTTVRPRLLLNDGSSGDVAHHFLTTAAATQVSAFGTGAAQGSALHGDSAALARNFIVLYADPAGLTPPLAATPVEASGAAVDATYAPFYQSEVAGQATRWGALVPNLLPNGVRRFEQRDRLTGQIVSIFSIPEGHNLTTGLATGDTSTGIRIPASGGFGRWQALRFPLANIENPTSSPTGDPDLDGVENLLEYAFAMDPFLASQVGLPAGQIEDFNGSPHLVFRYRRLLGAHGLSYAEELSGGLDAWTDAAPALAIGGSQAPNPDGLTETVTRRLLVIPGHRFVRLRVGQP